jgi:hypothetical protein
VAGTVQQCGVPFEPVLSGAAGAADIDGQQPRCWAHPGMQHRDLPRPAGQPPGLLSRHEPDKLAPNASRASAFRSSDERVVGGTLGTLILRGSEIRFRVFPSRHPCMTTGSRHPFTWLKGLIIHDTHAIEAALTSGLTNARVENVRGLLQRVALGYRDPKP